VAIEMDVLRCQSANPRLTKTSLDRSICQLLVKAADECLLLNGVATRVVDARVSI